jgi:hypothetical protein
MFTATTLIVLISLDLRVLLSSVINNSTSIDDFFLRLYLFFS